MIIKGILTEDFVNYKKPSMTIMFPYCTMKCGAEVCQNNPLLKEKNIKVKPSIIVDKYMENDITQALILQGLEPFDSWEDVWQLVCEFRRKTLDDIVIYTGYTEEEIYNRRYILSNLRQFPNIIIKFGRYIPKQKPHFDELLGVNLMSDNQYAKRVGRWLD